MYNIACQIKLIPSFDFSLYVIHNLYKFIAATALLLLLMLHQLFPVNLRKL